MKPKPSDSAAPSAAPLSALSIWSDGRYAYLEIPGRCGPYIARYNADSRGISLILNALGLNRVDYDYAGTIPDGYLKPSKEPGTGNQRATAEKLLRQRGLIK